MNLFLFFNKYTNTYPSDIYSTPDFKIPKGPNYKRGKFGKPYNGFKFPGFKKT